MADPRVCEISESLVVRSILNFLKRKGLIAAMRQLEAETHLKTDSYGKEVSYLRTLLLDGRWNDLEIFLEPFFGRRGFDAGFVLFAIQKQKFLELIDGNDKVSPAVMELVTGLKALEQHCSREDFQKLLYCLTLEKVSLHPDFNDWSPYAGRLQCFETIKPHLDSVLSADWIQKSKSQTVPELESVFQESLLYRALRFSHDHPSAPVPPKITFESLSAPLPTAALRDSFDSADWMEKPKEYVIQPLQYVRNAEKAAEPRRPLTAFAPKPEFVAAELAHGAISGLEKLSTEEVSSLRKLLHTPNKDPPAQQQPPVRRRPAPKAVAWEIPLDSSPKRVMPKKLEALRKKPLRLSAVVPGPPKPEEPQEKKSIGAYHALFRQHAVHFRPVAELLQDNAFRCCEFSPDGRSLAVGCNNSNAYLCTLPAALYAHKHVADRDEEEFSVRPLKIASTLGMQHAGSVFCVGWSQSGEVLATGSNDQLLKLSRVVDGRMAEERGVFGHGGTVRSLRFAEEGKVVSAGSGDGHAKLWDCTRAGRSKACLDPLLLFGPHGGSVFDVQAVQDRLYTACEDGLVRVFDIRTASPVVVLRCSEESSTSSSKRRQRNGLLSVSVRPCDPNTVATGNGQGVVSVFDVRGTSQLVSWRHHGQECRSVDFSPDGRWLLSASFDRSIAMIDCSTWEAGLATTLSNHTDKVLQATWHAQTPAFASVGADKKAILWSPVFKA